MIPPSRRARYNETLFGKLGRCRDHPAVASQLYSYPTAQDKTQIREPKPTIAAGAGAGAGAGADVVVFRCAEIFDFIEYSCLNGWSMGNAATSGRDLAQFFRDLFAPPRPSLPPRLLNRSTVAAMQSFVNLTNDWCSTCQYGLGLFKEDQYEISARSKPEQLYMVGHAGTNWASNAELSSYNPHFDFGIALATNSATGLDCSKDQPASEAEGDHVR